MAIGTSLRQAGDDIGVPGASLSNVHMRARVKDRKTGPISLRELQGATTSMCAVHSAGWTDGTTGRLDMPNAYTGYKEFTRGKNPSLTSSDTTKTIKMGVEGYIQDNDATCELVQNGYITEAGTYNFWGQFQQKVGEGKDSRSPWSVAIVCNSSWWLSGSQQVAMSIVDFSYDVKTVNQNFNIPAGYPYVSTIIYQFVYNHPNHGQGAGYYTPCYTHFTDCRLRKV